MNVFLKPCNVPQMYSLCSPHYPRPVLYITEHCSSQVQCVLTVKCCTLGCGVAHGFWGTLSFPGRKFMMNTNAVCVEMLPLLHDNQCLYFPSIWRGFSERMSLVHDITLSHLPSSSHVGWLIGPCTHTGHWSVCLTAPKWPCVTLYKYTAIPLFMYEFLSGCTAVLLFD